MKYPLSRILSILAAPVHAHIHSYSIRPSYYFAHAHIRTLARTHSCAHPNARTQEIEEKFASLSDELSAKLKEQTQRTRQAEQEIRDLTREFQACDAKMAASHLAKRTIIL